MRMTAIALVSALGLLGGCASTAAMDHGAMSQEEMMRHCAMMERHGGEGGAAHQHDPTQHGGMSHEEMRRHCQMMRDQNAQAPDAHAQETPHQH